jgi:hypothetical protein
MGDIWASSGAAVKRNETAAMGSRGMHKDFMWWTSVAVIARGTQKGFGKRNLLMSGD